MTAAQLRRRLQKTLTQSQSALTLAREIQEQLAQHVVPNSLWRPFPTF